MLLGSKTVHFSSVSQTFRDLLVRHLALLRTEVLMRICQVLSLPLWPALPRDGHMSLTAIKGGKSKSRDTNSAAR